MKNLSASIRQRLLDKARNEKRPFQELLQYFAMERFLYRLSRSPHNRKFILKGALLLQVWEVSRIRPTMDIDMLGKTSNDHESIAQVFQEILQFETDPDGLEFDSSSIQIEEITEEADYRGVRVKFSGLLEKAKIPMQIDIGFGDAIYPEARQSKFPVILDLPEPELLCYSRESSIAEKLQAMVHLGEINSRMKDFYDIWALSRQFDFQMDTLSEAIRQTFSHRDTEVPAELTAFSEQFVRDRQTLWNAFRKRLDQDHLPEPFSEIVSGIRDFILPVLSSILNQDSSNKSWRAPGPWG